MGGRRGPAGSQEKSRNRSGRNLDNMNAASVRKGRETMAFAQEEQQDQQEVLEIDPKNQAAEVSQASQVSQSGAEAEVVEEAMTEQVAVQPEIRQPTVDVTAIEDRSTYYAGEEIRVPTELSGQPGGKLELNLVAYRSGVSAVAALVPVVLPESGQTHHDWSFTPEIAGEYNLELVVVDNLGNQQRRTLTVFAEAKPQSDEAERQQLEKEEEKVQEADPAKKKELAFES